MVEVVPAVATTQNGFLPGGEVGFDHRGERIRAHAEFVIGRNVADVVEADAGGQSAAVDGRMRVLGGVENQRRIFPGAVRVGRGQLARGQDRVQAAGGSGVVNDAEEIVGQARAIGGASRA